MLLIFDMDMTLVDIKEKVDFDALLLEVLEGLGLEVPSRIERDRLWKSGKEHGEILAQWGVKDGVTFWEMFDELDYQARDQGFQSRSIRPYSDAKPCLERMKEDKRVVLALLTNTPKKLAFHELKTLGLYKYFDEILALNMGDYDQFSAKPEPDGIFILKQAILQKNDNIDKHLPAIMVGDSMVDMLAARNANIPGIQIARDPRNQKLGPAFVKIKSLDVITFEFLQEVSRDFRDFSLNHHVGKTF